MCVGQQAHVCWATDRGGVFAVVEVAVAVVGSTRQGCMMVQLKHFSPIEGGKSVSHTLKQPIG